jgi:hypothetical protein
MEVEEEEGSYNRPALAAERPHSLDASFQGRVFDGQIEA